MRVSGAPTMPRMVTSVAPTFSGVEDVGLELREVGGEAVVGELDAVALDAREA